MTTGGARPAPDRTPLLPRPLLLVLAGGLLVRLLVAVALRTWVFPNRWVYAFEMGWIAQAIASGLGFSWPGDPVQPTAWMAPAYPYLIAGVFEVFGIATRASAAVLELLQTAFSLATCVVLYHVSRRLFADERPALAAAAILALYPPAIHFSVQKIWDTALFTLVIAGVALLLLDLRARPGAGRAAAIGALFGLGALLEPTMLALLPVGVLWLGARFGSGRRALRLGALAALVAALLIAPWLVRNAVVFDRFVFLKSNFGHELMIGNVPRVRGAEVDRPDGRVKGVPDTYLTEQEVRFVEGVDEPTRTAFYPRKAAERIRAEPAEFARRTAGRVVQFWTFTRGRGAEAAIAALSYFPLLLLALASLAFRGARTADAALLWLLAAAIPLANYVTHVTHWRYRFPAEALLAVFAGLTLAEGWRRLRGRSSGPD